MTTSCCDVSALSVLNLFSHGHVCWQNMFICHYILAIAVHMQIKHIQRVTSQLQLNGKIRIKESITLSSVLDECYCILCLSRGFKKPLLTIYSLERFVLVSGEAWGHIHLKVLSYKYYEILSSTSTQAEIKSIT